MSKVKNVSSLLATLLAVVIVCIGCRESSALDFIQKIYDDGISQLEKAESSDDVQIIYDGSIEQVKHFMADHPKEIAELDSTALQKAEEAFLYSCCMKADFFDSGIDTDKGRASIDDSGKVFVYNPENDNQDLNNQRLNPLDVTDIIPIYKANQIDDEVTYSFDRMKILTSNGECLYDDQLIEQYGYQYIPVFFMAYMIAKDGKSHAAYLKEHLYEILFNLPLGDQYPQEVREYVNKKFYDYKDKAENMRFYKREYGYIEYAFEQVRGIYGEQNIRCFKVYRDNNTGRLTLGTSIHGYNPPSAY